MPNVIIFDILQILQPAVGSSSSGTAQIGSGCMTTASAVVFNVRQITSLSWSLAPGPSNVVIPISGISIGTPFSFAIGPLASNHAYTLTMNMSYVDNTGKSLTLSPVSQQFTAVGGGYSCGQSGVGAASFSNCPAEPIGVPLPRFYKLHLFTGAGHDRTVDDLLFGGLLQRSAIYLEYDLNLSCATQAVWKDINLPDVIGKWTLRLQRRGDTLIGSLTLFRLSHHQVEPPVSFPIMNWSLRGDNLLGASPSSGFAAQSSSANDLAVVISPA